MSPTILLLINDTARSYQLPDPSLDPASTDGIDHLFEATEPKEPSSQHLVDGSVLDLASSEHIEVISTEDAAKRLGISPRAIVKRLTKGTLEGEKVAGKFRTEWRVFWRGSAQGGTSEEQFRPSSEHQTIICNPVEEEPLSSPLMARMEALLYRNGYLEAQLEAERTKLLMLPDLQASLSTKEAEMQALYEKLAITEAELKLYKRGWWQRLKEIFYSP